jgi:hypothetical protein
MRWAAIPYGRTIPSFRIALEKERTGNHFVML